MDSICLIYRHIDGATQLTLFQGENAKQKVEEAFAKKIKEIDRHLSSIYLEMSLDAGYFYHPTETNWSESVEIHWPDIVQC